MKRYICLFLLIAPFSHEQALAALPDDLALPFASVDQGAPPVPYPILKPLAGGPLRILFIGNAYTVAPAAAGLAGRVDLEYESVLTPSRTTLGVQDASAPAPLREPSISRKIADLLATEWDVLWVDFELEALPVTLQKSVLDRVTAGAVLVVFGNRGQYQGIATDRNPDFRPGDSFGYRPVARAEALGRGKGIILALPFPPEEADSMAWGDYLNGASWLLCRASGRSSVFTLTAIDIPEKPIGQEVIGIVRFRLEVRHSSGSDSLRLMVRYRDKHNRLAAQSETGHLINEKELVSLRFPVLPVGTYSLDITGISNGRAVFFAGRTIDIDASDRISDIRYWYSAEGRNEFLIGTVTMQSPFKEGMRLVIDLLDDKGTILETSTPDLVSSRESADFIFKLKEEYPRAVFVRVSFFKNSECVDIREKPYFIADDPGAEHGFLLGVYDDCGIPPFPSEVYGRLAETGVGIIAHGIALPDTIGVFDRAIRISRHGIRIIPDLIWPEGGDSLLPSSAGLAAAGILDSFRSLDPPGVGVSTFEASHLARTVLPGKPVAIFPQVMNPLPSALMDSLSNDDTAVSSGAVAEGRNNGSRTGFMIPDSWKYPAETRALRAIPWWALFSGYSQLWWRPISGTWNASVTPQGAVSPAFEMVAAQVRAIAGGFDVLLESTEPVASGDPEFRATATDDAGRPVDSMLSRVFRDGPVIYAGFAMNPALASSPEQCRIQVDSRSGPVYVYDMLTSAFIGAAPVFSCSLTGGAALYAILPYRVQRVSLTSNSLLFPDEAISFNVSIETFENAQPGRHWFDISLSGAGPNSHTFARKTVEAVSGTCRGTFPFLNLPPGNYSLTARDLATGRSAERNIVVRVKTP